MSCEIQQPIFTRSGKVSGVIYPGTGVTKTTSVDGVNDTFVAATSGMVQGVASGVRVGGGTQEVYGTGDLITIYKPGSECIVLLTGNVTDLTLPLKISGNGYTPVTGNNDCYNVQPLELGSSGSYIRALVCNGYYGV